MIIIDGDEFNIPIVSMSAAADMLDKYANRTVDGILHRELIGVYDNYEIVFASSAADPDTYSDLWFKLTEPTSVAYSSSTNYSWNQDNNRIFCRNKTSSNKAERWDNLLERVVYLFCFTG